MKFWLEESKSNIQFFIWWSWWFKYEKIVVTLEETLIWNAMVCTSEHKEWKRTFNVCLDKRFSSASAGSNLQTWFSLFLSCLGKMKTISENDVFFSKCELDWSYNFKLLRFLESLADTPNSFPTLPFVFTAAFSVFLATVSFLEVREASFSLLQKRNNPNKPIWFVFCGDAVFFFFLLLKPLILILLY